MRKHSFAYRTVTTTRLASMAIGTGICLSSMSCHATSRLGVAAVSVTDNNVCFSVSRQSEDQKAKLDLFRVSVSETTRPSGDWTTLPDEVWSFSIDPPGRSIEINAADCLVYGKLPDGAKLHTPASRLKQNHPYVITIAAKSRAAGKVPVGGGYSAIFCLVPAANGSMTAQVLAVASEFERWKSAVCAFDEDQ